MTDDEIKKWLNRAKGPYAPGNKVNEKGPPYFGVGIFADMCEAALEARAEVERLTAERDQARKDAVYVQRHNWHQNNADHDAVIRRIYEYEADDLAKAKR